MKEIVLSVTMLLVLINSFAQTTVDSEAIKKYLDESKRQKTKAWVFLIGGTALGVLATSQIERIEHDPAIGFTESFNSGMGWASVGLVGATFVLCSIPLFIHSKKNARRASSISFNNHRILLPSQQGSISLLLSTLTLKLEL